MPKKKKKSSATKFYVIAIAFFVLIIAAFIAVFGPNTGTLNKGEFLYVHTGSNYEQLLQNLDEGGFIKEQYTFKLLANMLHLPAHIHAGKYRIKRHMSNFDIIKLLHSGKQTSVKLVINKIRTIHEFIHYVSVNLEADSVELNSKLHNLKYLKEFGFDTSTVIAGIIPDTYDFNWNTSADKAFRKIEKNYVRFWDNNRKAQAKEKGLTPIEVTTLASIIDEETNINDDKPNIASVYINRLNKNMKLQADPTVKFAVGDFSIKRVTGKLLETESPYNTYKYSGLPPGPICTPSPSSLQAVLEAPKTDYLYFCAKADFSGYSEFAKTFNEQKKNASAYWKALNERGIH